LFSLSLTHTHSLSLSLYIYNIHGWRSHAASWLMPDERD
jgi:hypothetical protein